MQQVTLNQTALSSLKSPDYPTMTTFKHKPFSANFPLPISKEDLEISDYTKEEYDAAEQEVNKYVVKRDNHVFLQLRLGLLLRAGTSEFSDACLVLTAKAIAALPVEVWHQERPDILPKIPKSDVVIPVPLTIMKPIYIKA